MYACATLMQAPAGRGERIKCVKTDTLYNNASASPRLSHSQYVSSVQSEEDVMIAKQSMNQRDTVPD